MSVYDQIVDHLHENIEKPQTKADGASPKNVQRGRRPLKMPKNYDFSVRNVKWGEYKNDFILRTDAVWERSKLFDIFHVHYKSDFHYDAVNNKYMIGNIRMMPLPTNEPEHLEDFVPFMGYSDIDGCLWQFKMGPMVQNPTSLSRFVADKEGDSWYLCFLTF